MIDIFVKKVAGFHIPVTTGQHLWSLDVWDHKGSLSSPREQIGYINSTKQAYAEKEKPCCFIIFPAAVWAVSCLAYSFIGSNHIENTWGDM